MLQYGYIIDSEMIFMMCARRIIVIFIRIGYGVFSGNELEKERNTQKMRVPFENKCILDG